MSIQNGHGLVHGNLKIHISDIGKKVITILYCGSPLSPIHRRFQQARSEIVHHGYRIERLPMPVAHSRYRYCTRFYPLCLRGQHLCRSFKNEISCLKQELYVFSFFFDKQKQQETSPLEKNATVYGQIIDLGHTSP